jgi:hypothetical protein
LSESFSDKGSQPGMVTTSTGVYFMQQLAALIPWDTPHEYAGGPALVKLAVDEDKRFRLLGDVPSFRLVRGELPFN